MERMNLVGARFEKLVVISQSEDYVWPNGQRASKWLCKCDCGNESIVMGASLRSGQTKSCGCLRLEIIRNGTRKTHGMFGSPEYSAWRSMLSRCENPKTSGFSRYGGRGISVCDSWHDFNNFYADMGARPEGTSIDRIDNNGNYEPSNCRWASKKEQGRNKRNNKFYEFNGQVKCLSEWAEYCGISRHVLWQRLNSGWTIDRALKTPLVKIDKGLSK